MQKPSSVFFLDSFRVFESQQLVPAVGAAALRPAFKGSLECFIWLDNYNTENSFYVFLNQQKKKAFIIWLVYIICYL